MIWNHTDKASLQMKNMSDDDLNHYLSKIPDEKLYAYNVYQIEGEGKNLFSNIIGDKDTIMGLPIKKIKEYLNNLNDIKRKLEMKKYLVIGNPIQHSLSPLIHNHLFKKYNIEASYEKKLINRNSLKDLILDIKDKKIDGINVTVPFKNEVIPYLDELSLEAKTTQSVNTTYYDKNKIIGHNTDIEGFESSIIDTEYKIKNKKILILGAGGVVSSIIFALNKMEVSKIFISNRTKEKAEKFKNLFKNIFVIDWGELVDVDVIINATSIGLNIEDVINLDFY